LGTLERLKDASVRARFEGPRDGDIPSEIDVARLARASFSLQTPTVIWVRSGLAYEGGCVTTHHAKGHKINAVHEDVRVHQQFVGRQFAMNGGNSQLPGGRGVYPTCRAFSHKRFDRSGVLELEYARLKLWPGPDERRTACARSIEQGALRKNT
jgi:hypothetical protein